MTQAHHIVMPLMNIQFVTHTHIYKQWPISATFFKTQQQKTKQKRRFTDTIWIQTGRKNKTIKHVSLSYREKKEVLQKTNSKHNHRPTLIRKHFSVLKGKSVSSTLLMSVCATLCWYSWSPITTPARPSRRTYTWQIYSAQKKNLCKSFITFKKQSETEFTASILKKDQNKQTGQTKQFFLTDLL